MKLLQGVNEEREVVGGYGRFVGMSSNTNTFRIQHPLMLQDVGRYRRVS